VVQGGLSAGSAGEGYQSRGVIVLGMRCVVGIHEDTQRADEDVLLAKKLDIMCALQFEVLLVTNITRNHTLLKQQL
jgi:hypothetical protein